MASLRRVLLPLGLSRNHIGVLRTHLTRNFNSLGCISVKAHGSCHRKWSGHFAVSCRSQFSPTHVQACLYSSHYDKWTELLYSDMVALMHSGDLQLIDVREPKEIEEQGNFEKALNIPLSNLKTTLLMEDEKFIERYSCSKPQKHDTNIVFVALGPIKSSAALELAHKIGYKKARYYKGGYEEWKEHHLGGKE